MRFSELDSIIPRVKGGKEKILRAQIYPNVSILMPGRHAENSNYGDFCVCVTDPVFNTADHQFTHTDIFKDISQRNWSSALKPEDLMQFYLDIIAHDADIPDISHWAGVGTAMDNITFLQAVQCLAVAEHRRYAQYEPKFGGRYLPFRFAAGIAEMLWTDADAANLQKKGRPGVEMLERKYGIPKLTSELMNETKA